LRENEIEVGNVSCNDLVFRDQDNLGGLFYPEADHEKVFKMLYSLNLSDKAKTKKTAGTELKYIPWSSVWAEIKKVEPTATYKVYPQTLDDFGNTRFWHDDERTGWVEVGVTIKGLEHVMTLAVMDYKNKAIPAAEITATDANKTMMRCLVKACAMHGIGMYVYEGEEIPDDERELIVLQNECLNLINKKCKLSDKAKEEVSDLCKAAHVESDPTLPENAITGSPKQIMDIDILGKLKKQLLAVRK